MEILSEKKFLEKQASENFDLFDTLRSLNANNVNDRPKELDELFSALTVVEDINSFIDLSSLREINEYLNLSYENGVLTIQVDDSKPMKLCGGLSVETPFTHYSMMHSRLHFKNNYITNYCGPQGYNPPRFDSLCALLEMRKVIKADPYQFDVFKLKITEFLIQKVCESGDKWYSQANKDAINKLMVILAEQVTDSNPSDEYPQVLSAELLANLSQISNINGWTNEIILYTLSETVKRFSDEKTASNHRY